jgi:hypothetical protein
MQRIIGSRRRAALLGSIVTLAALGAGAASASAATNAVTRTFFYTAKPGSSTKTLFSANQLTVNARCDSNGNPVVFAFSSANNADIFVRVFDGFGRLHTFKSTSFNRSNKGMRLSSVSNDFDSTGTALFGTATGNVVTVNYAFDNATTMNGLNICAVYGSYVAS